MIMAGTCGLLAAFFAFRGDFEKAFVAAAAGAVCWFLNYRQRLREALPDDDEQVQDDEEPDEEVPS
jgi:hypothetical protein